MKTMLLTLAAWLVALFVALSEAHACTIATDNLTGGYWINYYQGGAGGALTQWGDWSTPAIQLQVQNKQCNDLQSWGNITGNIHWFGNINAPTYAVGPGPAGTYTCGPWYRPTVCTYTNWATWVNPNEGATFDWDDGVNWNKAAGCVTTGNWYWVGNTARAQWQCTHKQSRDGGITWGGTSLMVLSPAL